ncbi:hypothetical protein SAMN05421747_1259 [Parapedobacter composti]|uniref:ATPase AAA-type core domain-containing protein n=2 Tax=Parapedobacter composti TaxID=623281 RepID=A0A1I1M7U5_9SPHI|nr:hypothetical protein SAMN05421747_1259 [Parapedobacter composti]
MQITILFPIFIYLFYLCMYKDEDMLISFAVTNFRSIKERMALDMVKTGLKGLDSNFFGAPTNKRLLKSAVIYGPNASGKSGFLYAFRALDYLVNRSSGFKPEEGLAPYEPHRLDKSCVDAPITLEISFASEDIRYDYTVSYNKKRIELEELYYYPHSSRTLLFTRKAGQETKFGDYYRGPKKVLDRLLGPNQLLLSKAAENNVEMLLPAYHFFANELTVYPFMADRHESSVARLYARRLAEDGQSTFSKRFNALICALDTGIQQVTAEKVDWSKYEFPGSISEEVKKQIQDEYKYDIKTRHPVFLDGKEVGFEKFDVEIESTGTRSLFVIGGIVLDALEEGKLLIVDEFEKNLHPVITEYLIKLFHNDITNPKNAQLVFATHDVTQLSNDNFRRDQIWFTQKDEYGATELFRASDIGGIRLNTPLDKWYVSGRFGATPVIDDSDFLIAMQEDGSEEG